MKSTILLLAFGFLLVSCVFDNPFSAATDRPVDPELLGRWQTGPDNEGDTPERMLVLKHSANEYLIEYPVGDEAMYFRGHPVKLDGGDHVQIQLLGTAEGPVKDEERRYHLLRVRLDGDQLAIQTIDPKVLGAKDGATTDELLAAFAAKKDHPDLFEDPTPFRRMK